MKNIGLITKTAGAALVLAAGLMTGCGSDSGGSSVKKGTFEDAAVIGISYKTATQEGTTDEKGTFKFKKGESVTFFIGDLELPAGIPQGNVITPAHLAGTADWENDDTAVNIIRFLLSIDADQDPDNGIQIPDGLAEFLTDNVDYDDVDFGDSGFDSGLDDLIIDLNAELTLDVTLVAVDASTAITHFTATIEGLGIDIEIQIVSTAVACTDANTSAIEGYYYTELTGTVSGELNVEVDGTSLIFDEEEPVTACTFVQTQVTTPAVLDIPAITIITSTWVWTDGTDVNTINKSEGVLSIIVAQGSDTGTGTLSENK